MNLRLGWAPVLLSKREIEYRSLFSSEYSEPADGVLNLITQRMDRSYEYSATLSGMELLESIWTYRRKAAKAQKLLTRAVVE